MGYAAEAAKQVLSFAFNHLPLEDIVSFTATINLPSQAVMQRIGMQDSKHNFMHPAIPKNSSLLEHVLYKISCVK
jgi:RimJ/RimL family protein N-acetyltransferase